jgi:hypothetical protein
MNRMIKLFQQRSDQAFEAFLKNRNDCIESSQIRFDSPEWQAAVNRGFDLKARAETWAKAAELLRKDAINNPQVLGNNPKT